MQDKILNSKGQTEEEFLREYDSSKYRKPSVTVDMLIFKLGKEPCKELVKECEVLMIKRGNFPDLGKWAFPGGFIGMEETLEESARRELEEETGVKGLFLEQIKTFGDPKRDKRDRVITVAYMSLIEENIKVKAGDDAADAKWFKVNLKKGLKTEHSEGDDQLWELSLTNENLNLNCKLVKRVRKIGMVKDKNFEIIERGMIASDHSRILAFGIERFNELLK